jgi:hypothetical protein
MNACETKQEEVALKILELNKNNFDKTGEYLFDINQQDENLNTALHYACFRDIERDNHKCECYQNFENVIDKILKITNINTSLTSKKNESALFFSIYTKLYKTAKKLMNLTSDVLSDDLYKLTEYGVSPTNLLLDYDNATDPDPEKEQIFKALLSHKNFDLYRNCDAVYLATRKCHSHLFKLMLSRDDFQINATIYTNNLLSIFMCLCDINPKYNYEQNLITLANDDRFDILMMDKQNLTTFGHACYSKNMVVAKTIFEKLKFKLSKEELKIHIQQKSLDDRSAIDLLETNNMTELLDMCNKILT